MYSYLSSQNQKAHSKVLNEMPQNQQTNVVKK